MANNNTSSEEKENITEEFMSGFGIESTSMLDSSDLTAYLEDDNSIVGDPATIKPVNTTATKPEDTKPVTSKSSKEEEDSKNKLAQERLEKEKNLNGFLNEDTITTKPDASEPKTDVDNNIADNLAIMSQEFYNMGFFTKDTDDENVEIRDPNQFLEKIQTSYKKGVRESLENYLGHFSPKNRELFFATYEKGVDPESYLLQLNKIESYEKMDLKVEDNQELVITQALRTQGWEEEDIKDQLTKLKGFHELEDTAIKYHKGLVKAEKANAVKLQEAALQEEDRKAQIDTEYDNNLRSVYTTKLKEKDFDGIPVTEKSVAKAYDFAYNKKWELNGALLTDFDRFILDLKKPENHEVKAKLALLFAKDYEIDKPIKLDLSPIQKKAVSNEKTTLFNSFAQNKKTATPAPTTKSFFD